MAVVPIKDNVFTTHADVTYFFIKLLDRYYDLMTFSVLSHILNSKMRS